MDHKLQSYMPLLIMEKTSQMLKTKGGVIADWCIKDPYPIKLAESHGASLNKLTEFFQACNIWFRN